MKPIYFEVTLQPADHAAEPESEGLDVAPSIVSLGFCGEFSDQTYAHPGWNMWTVGYHGDDGAIFEEEPYETHKTGCKFGPGQTVGCGIDYDTEEYFFTREGEIVGMFIA